MTKRRHIVKRNTPRTRTFLLRNEFWHECYYIISGWLAWCSAHLKLRRRPRPIRNRSASARMHSTQTAAPDASASFAFTCSLVALHAQLAKFKGSLSSQAFLEFRCLFPVGDTESHNLRSLFTFAWEDDEPIASHIQRMVACYPNRRDLFVDALEGLARHMLADGRPSKPQLKWLNQVAQGFGMSRIEMHHIVTRAEKPIETRPHQLFKLPKRASESEMKQAYRRFMQRCHPDHNAKANLPETRLASERLSRAGNLAYRKLKG